ncbi:hypothetical protein ABIA45_007516 [Bradyrhizobium sp. USDA 336]
MRTRRGGDHTRSGRIRFRNLTCCVRGRHLRNPRRPTKGTALVGSRQLASQRDFSRDHGLNSSIDQTMFSAARSRSFSTRRLQASRLGQRRFGGRRNDRLVRSVWRRTFDSCRGHQSRPESNPFPRSSIAQYAAVEALSGLQGSSEAIRAPFRNPVAAISMVWAGAFLRAALHFVEWRAIGSLSAFGSRLLAQMGQRNRTLPSQRNDGAPVSAANLRRRNRRGRHTSAYAGRPVASRNDSVTLIE